MRITTLILLIVFSFSLKAQYLHTPSQIESITKKSEIKYELDSIEPKLLMRHFLAISLIN